ncbi:hypothetical protein SAMD00019534_123780 [Acytostelium subglobosum LB1]|uniref:hypothetical protein n=1 Tax=Acytostelium subglobosum LB1 TaxID=1410327 RepID=UPI00064501A2|nr:hypothetical protein SAMD00019534_123780 [Acytostelium subglobosum LB1]GAM29202.1 hypothetical protein SAMD00019534_123780 [Acytostelium subglobosum LB1]|eukprot:XP_012747893.1 hypothetical protein SAMD00019534_123780 [Acytostelium subglobosum LB1]
MSKKRTLPASKAVAAAAVLATTTSKTSSGVKSKRSTTTTTSTTKTTTKNIENDNNSSTNKVTKKKLKLDNNITHNIELINNNNDDDVVDDVDNVDIIDNNNNTVVNNDIIVDNDNNVNNNNNKDTVEDKDVNQSDSKAAWVDEDDDEEYEKKKLLNMEVLPTWAVSKDKETTVDGQVNEDQDLENKAFGTDSRIGRSREDNYLNLHLTSTKSAGCHISNIDLNPESNILLTVQTNGISMFSTFDLAKPMFTTVLKGFGCTSGKMLTNSKECVIIGHKPFFFTFNTETLALKKHQLRMGGNKLGLLAVSEEHFAISDALCKISIMSCRTKTVVREFQLGQSSIASMQFSPTGEHLYIVSEGHLTCYSVKLWRIVHRFKDEGNLGTKAITSFALSPNGTYLATGSESGMINIYNTKQCFESASPSPLKVIRSVLYPITTLVYDARSKYLLAASAHEDGIVRLISHPEFAMVDWGKDNTVKMKTTMAKVTSGVFSKGTVLYLSNTQGSIIKVKGFPKL